MSELEINAVETVHIKFTTKIKDSAAKNVKSLFQTLILNSCLLNRNKRINAFLIFFLISLTCWSLMFLTLGKEALPGGICFSLFVLIVSCHIIGYLFELIKMPNLLGNLKKNLFF